MQISSKLVSRAGLMTVAAAIVGVGTLSGCVGYAVYPPMEGERGFSNVNSDPFPPVMTEALRWTALRYPPNEHAEWHQPAKGNVGTSTFAVNLPPGMNREIGERIAKNIGMGAQPMLPGNEQLPVYHISRVWVQGDEAKVDVIRPVSNVAFDAQGSPVTQGITIRLRGGMEPWHVTSHRLWSYNALETPALAYLPGSQMEAAAPQAQPSRAVEGDDGAESAPTTRATPEN